MSIDIRNVRKTFGDFIALENINLDIASGELLALLGPSGCGKTTLLRIIAGLETPDSGQILFHGEDATDRHVSERQVGFVFQHYALFRHMTVFDNVAFGLSVRPRRSRPSKEEIRERVMKLLKLVQLDWLADAYPAQLSGGQRQRVAMGRAIVRNPAVFLMDEPLSNLDAKLRVSMRTEISRLHKKLQTTMIYVTHDQIEAMTLGDRIVVMNDGIIQQVDTPMNLYNHPCNLFVAGFIGNPPMNFLQAELRQDGDEFYAESDAFRAVIPKEYAQKLKDKERIVFGIRPDDVHDAELLLADKQEIAFTGKIDVVEMLGSEVLLHVVHGEQKLTARMPAGKAYKSGDTVQLVFSMDRMHAFDPVSALNLLYQK